MDNPTEVMFGGDHYDIANITPRIYALKNGLDPDGANIVKYIYRARRKGQFKLDIRKAIHVAELRRVWLKQLWYAYTFTGHDAIWNLVVGEIRLSRDQIEALHLAENLFMVEVNRRLTTARRDVARQVETTNLVRHLQTMLDGEPDAA